MFLFFLKFLFNFLRRKNFLKRKIKDNSYFYKNYFKQKDKKNYFFVNFSKYKDKYKDLNFSKKNKRLKKVITYNLLN